MSAQPDDCRADQDPQEGSKSLHVLPAGVENKTAARRQMACVNKEDIRIVDAGGRRLQQPPRDCGERARRTENDAE